MDFTVARHSIKGDTHTICDDYAITDEIRGLDLSVRANPLIIVSDGCSAAPESDVGARIVALAARKVLSACIAGLLVPSLDEFADQTLDIAERIASGLGLFPISNAATLLAAFVLDGTVHVFMYGDGYWYGRRVDGAVFCTEVMSAELPPYLIYRRKPGDYVFDMTITEYPSGETRSTTEHQFHWSFPIDGIAEIGLCTDGAGAVLNQSACDVIARLSGGSLSERVDTFLQHQPYLYDDLGIASIQVK